MKKFILFLFTACILLICGCDYREIDRGYLVSSIGFSTADGSVNIYIEAISTSDTAEKPSERVLLTANGTSVQHAFQNVKSNLVKPLYFEQLGAVVFQKQINSDAIEFLESISGINYGIQLVCTDDINALFNAETPNGILGYDVIGLIKTNAPVHNKLFERNRNEFALPTVNFADGKIIFKASGGKE